MDSRLWESYREKIRIARAKEVNDLHSHFVSAREKIGDFEVVPVTLEKFAFLSLDEVWETIDPSIPVIRALWILSPHFSNDPLEAKKFIQANRDIDWTKYFKPIQDYINQAFDLAPKGGQKSENSKEWISNFVDTFASEYGWEESKILTTPLPRLFLYLRRIQERNTGNPIEFHSEADRLQAEFMRRMNERN